MGSYKVDMDIIRCDTDMGNTVTIQSQVGSGMGKGWTFSNLQQTVPFTMGCMGM